MKFLGFFSSVSLIDCQFIRFPFTKAEFLSEDVRVNMKGIFFPAEPISKTITTTIIYISLFYDIVIFLPSPPPGGRWLIANGGHQFLGQPIAFPSFPRGLMYWLTNHRVFTSKSGSQEADYLPPPPHTHTLSLTPPQPPTPSTLPKTPRNDVISGNWTALELDDFVTLRGLES